MSPWYFINDLRMIRISISFHVVACIVPFTLTARKLYEWEFFFIKSNKVYKYRWKELFLYVLQVKFSIFSFHFHTVKWNYFDTCLWIGNIENIQLPPKYLWVKITKIYVFCTTTFIMISCRENYTFLIMHYPNIKTDINKNLK